MTYRAEVDQDLCISSGRCVSDLPTVFEFDEDQLAIAIGIGHPIDDMRLVRVARNCPGQAITLRDDTGELIDLDG